MSASQHPPAPPKTVAIAVAEQPDQAIPKIVASGRGYLAEKMLEVAFANGIKVREDADLAEILQAVDVDSDIPTEAFAAVAEILTYLYRANGETPPASFPLERDMMTVAAIQDELLKVDSLIGTAIALLAEDRIVDLTALEERTRRICDAALALDGEERKTLVPAMETMLANLDALTADLHARFGDLPALSAGPMGSDAASSAYNQALKHLVTPRE